MIRGAVTLTSQPGLDWLGSEVSGRIIGGSNAPYTTGALKGPAKGLPSHNRRGRGRSVPGRWNSLLLLYTIFWIYQL